MDLKLEQRLIALRKDNAAENLSGGLRGLEKESLRVAESGGISQTPHPQSIGAALTNPWITTDYSEALTEFITPPMVSSEDALCFLQDAQTFIFDLQDIGIELSPLSIYHDTNVFPYGGWC